MAETNAFEIKSFQGGPSPYEDKGPTGSFKFGTNLDIRKKVDSLSAGQALTDEGLHTSHSPSASTSPSVSVSRSPSPSASKSISPTPSPSASASPSVSVSLSGSVTPSRSISPSPSPSSGAGVSTVFEGLIHFFVKGSDGYTYAFDNVGCVYRRDSDAFWQRIYKDPDGAIIGAAEWPQDNGKTYLFWATLRKLHKKEIPGRSDWNDVDAEATWPKTNLESADWHTMAQSGGSLMIANRNFVALVGYDGSYTNEFVNLIPGNEAKTIVERNGRAIIGTARRSDPTRGVNGAIDSEYPLAQIGGAGEIFFANMSDSIASKKFPGGGKVNPGGVANEIEEVNFFEAEQNSLSWIDKQSVGNMSLWGVFNADSGRGGIYTYGRRTKDQPFVLNCEYLLDVNEIGAVVNTGGVTLASYRSGSTFGVKAVDSTTKATGTYEGLDLRAPTKKVSENTEWKWVELYMAPLPTGTSVEFWYKLNKSGSFTRAYLADGGTAFSTAGGKKAVFRIGENAEIFEPRVVLNPTGNYTPEIYRIRIYFS